MLLVLLRLIIAGLVITPVYSFASKGVSQAVNSVSGTASNSAGGSGSAAATANTVKLLLEVIQAKKSFHSNVDHLIQMQVETNTEAKANAKDVREFYYSCFNWDTIETEVINMYQKHFSEKEVQELIRFFRSMVGQKVLEFQPQILSEMMSIGQRKMDLDMPAFREKLKLKSKKP